MKSKDIAKSIGLLPQNSVAPEGITVAELVTRGRFPYRKFMCSLTSEDYAAVKEAMESMKICDLADRSIDELSGGQRQRVFIALALAQQTDILFLDEPTVALDPQVRRKIWELIQNLKSRGITIILTTHYIEEAEFLCDRVAILNIGKLVALDTTKNLCKGKSLEEIFIQLTN